MNMPLWLQLICLVIGMAFLDLAIAGKTYSHGRGGQRTLLASVRSVPPRLGFFLAGTVVIIWVARNYMHSIRP